MKLTPAQKSVLIPLIFFDMFDVPLTESEFWQFCFGRPINRAEFKKTIFQLLDKKIIKRYHQWYILAGRKKIIDIHQQRQAICHKNWLIAQAVSGLFWRLPFVRMAAAINNLSFNNCHSDSDIDLFIVTSPNRLWLCRSLLITVLWLLGLKKTKTKIAGRICCGFFITADHLNIRKILLAPGDIYLLFWFLKMTPLAGFKAWENFCRANHWAYDFFPNYDPKKFLKLPEKQSWLQKIGELGFWGRWGDFLNNIIGIYHKRHTWSLPENRQPTSTTIAEDNILKLHAKDRRQFYQDKFDKKIRKLLT